MAPRRMEVVAIGASAGGIEAFRSFFDRVPLDSGMAFIVVLHLAADRKSMLADMIGRWTRLPVREAVHGEELLPNQVFVIPSGVIATVEGGRVKLRRLAADVPREKAPIDTLLDSVAADLGEAAIGIVLSGTGHDGALGLKAIKVRGGVTFAQGTAQGAAQGGQGVQGGGQSPQGSAPQHRGMPDSAIATGAVDFVVPVEDMPGRIMALRAARTSMPPIAVDDSHPARLRICEILLARVGHDFSRYKDKTFLRRVERRMQVLGISTLDDYAARIDGDQTEALHLFRDLLIGVTEFFRDAEVFEALKHVVMPRLFAGKGAADTVRVWVPGCATGEEAYSLAILLCEHMDGLDVVPQVQVFATDIDEPAVATARAGRYPATLLNGLSEARRSRFFQKSETAYVVAREIRDLCTFSAHSLVRDPPFSRMDLVSCRNLLIYMNTELQSRVIPMFHYSLIPGGILLLGSAETVVRHEALFDVVDKTHRVYLRREGPSPPLKVPAGLRRPPIAMVDKLPGQPGSAAADPQRDWTRALQQAGTRVLERYASPYVVVSGRGEVAHYSSHVGNYLMPALGVPSMSVFDLARRGLQTALRAALKAAVASGRRVEQSTTMETETGAVEAVTLVVEPLPGPATDRPFLIVFKERPTEPAPRETGDPEGGPFAVIAQLEREIRDGREQLQSLNEEHATALEELRSANEELHCVNEELQSSNEELQSSNEELETSKEEIQSINEELQTVNAELSTKVDELDRANSDLRNLFESTRVATVFLDDHLVIRGFTPEVGTIYNLIPSDRGRPLTDIVSRLDYPTLREDVQSVLATLTPLERRVARADGVAHYLVRILPYRAPDSTVEGSLITFVDVTTIVQAEAHQRLLVDELNHRVKNMLTVVISIASQTLQKAGSLQAFSGVFLGRIHALTAAYTLISQASWSSVGLRDIILEEMRPYIATDRTNITADGPAVTLDPRAVVAFGMAIHELATNAVKHGALSTTQGDVSIMWTLDDTSAGEFLVLTWTERNGPPVAPPIRRGFGRTLIERGLTHDLGGEVTLDFAEDGLRARIRAPLKSSVVATLPAIT